MTTSSAYLTTAAAAQYAGFKTTGAIRTAVREGAVSSPVAFRTISSNGKLAPVLREKREGKWRLRPHGPRCSSTYVSIESTCPSSCPMKGAGCYVQVGLRTRSLVAQLDEAAVGMTSREVILQEVGAIDRAFRGGPIPQDGARGGRDLRFHESGDIRHEDEARLLGAVAARYRARGGGDVWTFTHSGLKVPRAAFGPAISVLASVECVGDMIAVREMGYAPAIVVPELPARHSFKLTGSTVKVVPCRYETEGVTCVECRLCLNDDRIYQSNVAIGFEAHGAKAATVRELLRARRGVGEQGGGKAKVTAWIA